MGACGQTRRTADRRKCARADARFNRQSGKIAPRGNDSSSMQRVRAAHYDPLTRVFKPITTALWHGRGNRAATVRGEPFFSRRQMEVGRIAAGSGRAGNLRLDPFSLPVRFEAADEAADERLSRRRPAPRARGGSPLGRRHAHGAQHAGRRLSRRRHPALRRSRRARRPRSRWCSNTPIRRCRCRFTAHAETDDIVAEWQSWGRVLGLPLLVAQGDGSLREPFARLGALRIEAPAWRRRRRTAIARRRPSRLLRRRPGAVSANAGRASRRARDHREELGLSSRLLPLPACGERVG